MTDEIKLDMERKKVNNYSYKQDIISAQFSGKNRHITKKNIQQDNVKLAILLNFVFYFVV